MCHTGDTRSAFADNIIGLRHRSWLHSLVSGKLWTLNKHSHWTCVLQSQRLMTHKQRSHWGWSCTPSSVPISPARCVIQLSFQWFLLCGWQLCISFHKFWTDVVENFPYCVRKKWFIQKLKVCQTPVGCCRRLCDITGIRSFQKLCFLAYYRNVPI